MDELQQTNQELYEVVSQLAESNRNFEQRLYTLERVIGIREERIRYLEEELNNAIELSTQDKKELLEEISKLKRIVHQLEEENKKKDKEISKKDKLISEFDEREIKLKTRIREISKSAGNTPKIQDYTTRLVDENEHLKREINMVRTNQINRISKINQQKNRITDLLCQNFALALLRYRDRLELINTRDALQNVEAWNLNENESDSNENSLNIYNRTLDMATIAELADAIDRSLNDTTICKTILSNQIKRSTRQICRKYTNLQQDLVNEQWYSNMYRQERDQALQELQECKTDGAITTYLLDIMKNQYIKWKRKCKTLKNDLLLADIQLDLKWGKWKNRTCNAEQLILNLQQQNFALVNNQQNQAMAGNPLPTFSGKRDESIPDFLAHLRAELEGRNIDVADGAGGPPAGRVITKGLLRGCMRGKALEWYDENITTKQNFELHNLLDNTGQANIQAVATRTRAQLGNQALREANGRHGNVIIPLRATNDP
ncbi:hypothetical protein C2G38_2221521 [Gigaspora rosea]|uniref:Uncharacterized protein n=1 Tax=Gigaspora rosea TaxID=44941 RepID=A0A397UBL5_9GLOM|nr:hypothetical protein C2G38_2221521 [Gigaspora rosea]